MRPVDRHVEERPYLLTLPVRPFDASEVVYRTVDAEGFVVYRNNFYATPWRLIGQPVAVRTTEDELVIHDRAFVEAVRHRLFPRTVAGQRSLCNDHEPPRDSQHRLEQLTRPARINRGFTGTSAMSLKVVHLGICRRSRGAAIEDRSASQPALCQDTSHGNQVGER